MIYVNASILDEKPSGLGVYAKNVIGHLAALDPSVKVFCPIPLENAPVCRINRFVKPSYKKLGAVARLGWTQCVLPLKTRKTDTVYHPFQYLSLLSPSRQVMTIHDFIPLYYPQVARHQYHYYRFVMPLLLKRADKVICGSENTRQDVLKFYDCDAAKLFVVLDGYDGALFNEAVSREGVLAKYGIAYPYILLVGAGHEHKNLHRVIRAYKALGSGADCKVVIVGGHSPYAGRLREIVRSLSLESQVIFAGYVPDADLPAFYAGARCFAYPSLYEGFGLPVLEAMACGAPVICSNTSSLPEVAGQAALMFNPKDEEDIRHCLERVLTDAALGATLRDRGRERVKPFSWEATAKGIYACLQA